MKKLNPLYVIIFIETLALILPAFRENEPTTVECRKNELIYDYQRANSTLDNVEMVKIWTKEFKELAYAFGTDKGSQQYYNMYGTHLGPIKHKPLDFLEIGLGCGMPWGAGKSLLVWREYIPKARISFIEYDARCAEKFRDKLEHLFVGDQSDPELLEMAGERAGPFDFIVDDGGHYQKNVIASFLNLWPYLKPNGGTYVIEDMWFSYNNKVNGHLNESSIDIVHKLIMLKNDAQAYKYVPLKDHKFPVNDPQFSAHLKSISKSILSINCYHHACAIVKK